MSATRFFFTIFLLSLANPLSAQEGVAGEEILADGSTGEDDVELLSRELSEELVLKEEKEEEISIDAEGSLKVPVEVEGRRGWGTFGDLRGLGSVDEVNGRDGETYKSSAFLMRLRGGATWRFTDSLLVRGRLAASCSSETCKVENLLDDDSHGGSDTGFEVDEAFLHWYRGERFDLAVGRFQTKFITKGGVFAKSLDRNDSNNTRITWTDGAHGTLHLASGWESHLILQYNPEDGPAQVLRDPLDFSSSSSRASGFLSFLNEEPVRFLTQRAFDISYYPSSLPKDGAVEDSRPADYWGFVARAAGRYPKRSSGRRLRFSAEVGYAPNTPSLAAIDLPGDGDTDGLAIALTFSLMDFVPKHSIGVNLAHTGSGWLLSPQYNKNERLIELRYVWVARPRLTIDARIRYREELHQQVDAVRPKSGTDAFLRLTMRFRKSR